MLVVLAGTIGSGKDTIGNHLAKYHFWHISAGDVLREAARSSGEKEPFSRAVLEKAGDALALKYGPGPIAHSALAKYETIKTDYPAGIVISGFRRMPEVAYMKENGAKIIFLDAPVEIRYKRVIARSRGDDIPSLETFKTRENVELNGLTSEGKEGIYILGVKSLADIVIENNGELDGVLLKVNHFLGLPPKPTPVT
jgi:dephospho-CoA kinase